MEELFSLVGSCRQAFLWIAPRAARWSRAVARVFSETVSSKDWRSPWRSVAVWAPSEAVGSDSVGAWRG